MMELKVYGGCYDGKNRVIVAATSKKEAHAKMSAALHGISYYTWNEFTADTGDDKELAVALSAPGTVFSAKNGYQSEFAALPSP